MKPNHTMRNRFRDEHSDTNEIHLYFVSLLSTLVNCIEFRFWMRIPFWLRWFQFSRNRNIKIIIRLPRSKWKFNKWKKLNWYTKNNGSLQTECELSNWKISCYLLMLVFIFIMHFTVFHRDLEDFLLFFFLRKILFLFR